MNMYFPEAYNGQEDLQLHLERPFALCEGDSIDLNRPQNNAQLLPNIAVVDAHFPPKDADT